MSQQLLLDTEMLYLLAAQPDQICERCHQEIEEAASRRDLCVSIVSLLQLREAAMGIMGVVNVSELGAIDTWMNLHTTQILPLDVRVLVTIAKWTTQPEPLANRLIVATAQNHSCKLVVRKKIENALVEQLVCNHIHEGNAD